MGTPDIIPEQSPQVSWISQAELAAKLALIKEQQEPKNQSLIDAKQCVPNLQKESVPMESLAKHLAMAKTHIHKVGKPNRYLGGNLGRMRKFLASERKFLG